MCFDSQKWLAKIVELKTQEETFKISWHSIEVFENVNLRGVTSLCLVQLTGRTVEYKLDGSE